MTGEQTEEQRAEVLVVDDEERVVQAFDLWLSDEFEITTATGGNEALEAMHDGIDVVLLDRHMPDMSGDDVLREIRDTGYDCRVGMVTAVAPDFDIVDMPFDHYVSKPVDEPALRETVRQLVSLGEYDEQMNELYVLSQKIATLEAEKTASQLRDHDEYESLVDRRDTLQEQSQELIAEMDTADIQDLFEPAADR